MTTLSKEDLISAQADLDGLLETVSVQEGHMSVRGEKRKGPATRALENLRKTRVSFGQPRDSLVHLDAKLFKSLGIKLDPLQQAVFKTENFYYLTMPVSMIPGDAVTYDQIKCQLEFGPPGKNVPIVHSMFPDAQWREVLRFGAEVNVGLNADLTWGVGVGGDKSLVAKLVKQLPAEVRAQVKNKDEYKGFIAIPGFSFSMGRPDVAATGVGNNFCFWDIQKPDLKQTQTVKFGIIFKVPKGVKKIALSGVTAAETSRNWLFSNLKPLLKSLTGGQRDRVAKGLPLGDCAEWTLSLPA